LPRVIKSPFVKVDEARGVTITTSNANNRDNNLTRGYGDDDDAMTIVQKAKYQAKSITDQAKFEAKIISATAQADSEQKSAALFKKVEEEAYAIGYDKGVAASDKLRKEAQKVLDDAHKEREQIIDSIEGDVIHLVIEILDKLIYDAIEINPQIIGTLIKRGLTSSNISGDIKIRVSVDEYEDVLSNIDEISKYVDSSSHIEIVKDVSIGKMGCLIETQFGNIDSSLEHQYEALKKDLHYIFENR